MGEKIKVLSVGHSYVVAMNRAILRELAEDPRPAAPITPADSSRYELPGPVTERCVAPIGADDGLHFFRGSLACGGERAAFELVVPDGTDSSTPCPFVIALPILAGGQELMWFVAADLAARGYAVAWPRRVASALRADQRGPDLERLFQRSVVHARMVLSWSRDQPEFDAQRTGLVGISLGSMIGSAVLAVEPSIAAGALCLAGGDLPDMLMVSTEDRAVRWRRQRTERDALDRTEFARELRTHLVSDPALLGRYVDARRVLLVSATFDTVVPRRHQDLLWESLGRPRRMWVPFGHYTAALSISSILDQIGEFFDSRGV